MKRNRIKSNQSHLSVCQSFCRTSSLLFTITITCYCIAPSMCQIEQEAFFRFPFLCFGGFIACLFCSCLTALFCFDLFCFSSFSFFSEFVFALFCFLCLLLLYFIIMIVLFFHIFSCVFLILSCITTEPDIILYFGD